MQNHITKIKISKTIKIIIILFLCFLTSIVLFGIVILDQEKSNRFKSINEKAGLHYNYFVKNKYDLLLQLNIPETGIYYITGECFDSKYYLAYKNEINDKNILLTGNTNTQPNGFWGIKIVDYNITETWYSSNKLSIDDLITYSSKEQKKKMKLFESENDKNIIGYYTINLSWEKGKNIIR